MKRIVSILLFAILVSGCMKHENLYNAEQAAEEEAKKNFPVQDIDPGQDWNMTTFRSLNVSVNEKTGGTYTLKIYDGYPFSSDGAYLLAKEEVEDGETKTIKFDAPTILKRVYVMRQLTSTDYYVKVADLKDEQFNVVFGEALSKATAARGSARAMAFNSKYEKCPVGAQEVEGKDLKNLNKAGDYVIRKTITVYDGVKIGNNVHLYIVDNGALVMEGTGNLKMDNNNSSVSVLGGRLEIQRADLEINGNNSGNDNPEFYCGDGGVVSVEDVDLKDCLWVNDGTFTASTNDGFEMGHGVQLQNNCRLEIKSKKGGKDVILKTAKDKGSDYSVFNNQGYVKVDGDAQWGNIYVNLAGEGVFDIKGDLDLEDHVTFTVIGSNTLIKADEIDWNEDVKISANSAPLKVSCEDIDDDEKDLPKNLELVNPVLIDNGGCTIGYGNTEDEGNDKVAVTTFGFEDTVSGATDYDFNDVVFHVSNLIDNKIKVTLVATGATHAITAQYSLDNGVNYTDMFFNGESEVHAAFGKPIAEMINTNRSITIPDSNFPSYEIENVPDDFSFATNGRICIKVDDVIIDSHNKIGRVPYALSVPIAWAYPTERVRIDVMYEKFGEWGENMDKYKDWYMFKTE